MGTVHDLLRTFLQDWTSNDWSNRPALVSGAAAHNAHIRAIVPASNLLEFRGKEIPDQPFPRANVGYDIAGRMKIGLCVRTATIFAQAVRKWVIPVALVAAGWWMVSQYIATNV